MKAPWGGSTCNAPSKLVQFMFAYGTTTTQMRQVYRSQVVDILLGATFQGYISVLRFQCCAVPLLWWRILIPQHNWGIVRIDWRWKRVTHNDRQHRRRRLHVGKVEFSDAPEVPTLRATGLCVTLEANFTSVVTKFLHMISNLKCSSNQKQCPTYNSGFSRDFADGIASTKSRVRPPTPQYNFPKVAVFGSCNTLADSWFLGCVFVGMSAIKRHVGTNHRDSFNYTTTLMRASNCFLIRKQRGVLRERSRQSEWCGATSLHTTDFRCLMLVASSNLFVCSYGALKALLVVGLGHMTVPHTSNETPYSKDSMADWHVVFDLEDVLHTTLDIDRMNQATQPMLIARRHANGSRQYPWHMMTIGMDILNIMITSSPGLQKYAESSDTQDSALTSQQDNVHPATDFNATRNGKVPWKFLYHRGGWLAQLEGHKRIASIRVISPVGLSCWNSEDSLIYVAWFLDPFAVATFDGKKTRKMCVITKTLNQCPTYTGTARQRTGGSSFEPRTLGNGKLSICWGLALSWISENCILSAWDSFKVLIQPRNPLREVRNGARNVLRSPVTLNFKKRENELMGSRDVCPSFQIEAGHECGLTHGAIMEFFPS
ncbi:uncharacterized protein BDR25DRAFT_356513 [Lindgomyces ingoldianus]|uniref:Uncharacterized protein n=1 Tax=Lindgomyces ingoldianus TaxID=673940 RepID=A0ACB6QQK5_9PLEO|nr:uncharacterized protein BDR25DRAFT_356513 [Lindgomyces ingoldianus]KAF2469274.1 hypothetical protein BDR25DRAFT_356513 [Lindgomyces ingoldianus]